MEDSAHLLHLPHKILSIIQALHKDSVASVRAYGKTSEEFPISSGVRQGCILAPTLFNLYFDLVTRTALEPHQKEGKGVRMAYIHDGKLVGNRKKLCWETLVSDLEYADDMVLVSNSWEDLKAMMESLDARIHTHTHTHTHTLSLSLSLFLFLSL